MAHRLENGRPVPPPTTKTTGKGRAASERKTTENRDANKPQASNKPEAPQHEEAKKLKDMTPEQKRTAVREAQRALLKKGTSKEDTQQAKALLKRDQQYQTRRQEALLTRAKELEKSSDPVDLKKAEYLKNKVKEQRQVAANFHGSKAGSYLLSAAVRIQNIETEKDGKNSKFNKDGKVHKGVDGSDLNDRYNALRKLALSNPKGKSSKELKADIDTQITEIRENLDKKNGEKYVKNDAQRAELKSVLSYLVDAKENVGIYTKKQENADKAQKDAPNVAKTVEQQQLKKTNAKPGKIAKDMQKLADQKLIPELRDSAQSFRDLSNNSKARLGDVKAQVNKQIQSLSQLTDIGNDKYLENDQKRAVVTKAIDKLKAYQQKLQPSAPDANQANLDRKKQAYAETARQLQADEKKFKSARDKFQEKREAYKKLNGPDSEPPAYNNFTKAEKLLKQRREELDALGYLSNKKHLSTEETRQRNQLYLNLTGKDYRELSKGNYGYFSDDSTLSQTHQFTQEFIETNQFA